ncbi:TIGR03086 family metal-binding protein [Streptomyces sp. XM4193]|uniref:TIGR03086 family metal-binding protein n=1 Tax=Streptomyces sp. XM4193 TaxID=2929782 RepID=UPI001FFAB71A|nr:TIGR03086 family metal-binding protein [Streptomyces sp. XM4193]MCK1798396.1 TIGR03086 family metal-binding protein [Streptomyces sp. XM4193]
MNATPVDDLATVLGAVGDVLTQVREDQWHAPTPSREWDVREVVNHMVLGDLRTAEVLCGGPGLAVGAFDPTEEDALGDEEVASYRSAGVKLLAALRQPGVLEQSFELPIGTVPGFVIVHVRTVEALVHGWDVARAIGRRLEVPEQLAEAELLFSSEAMAGAARESMPFASPEPVADDAPALDRLAAFLGRPVAPEGLSSL